MPIRFNFAFDTDCGLPHCWVRHLVSEGEAIEAWYKGRSQEKELRSGAFTRRTVVKSGRDIQVVWRWIQENQRVFIITAYDFGKEAQYVQSE